jgi:molybdopterin/thiamine biosynthesis adenylyltransferase
MRQADVLPYDKLKTTRITIIGAGAIGSAVATHLVKMGVGWLTIFDDDTVELHNLPNQGYRLCDLGKPKVVALAELLESYGGHVTPRQELYTDQDVEEIVITAVDDMDVRTAIWNALKKRKDQFKMLVDCRMGALFGRVLVVNPKAADEVSRYERLELYPSTEAMQAPCTERATIYCASGLSAFAASVVGNALADKPYKRLIQVDFNDAQIL